MDSCRDHDIRSSGLIMTSNEKWRVTKNFSIIVIERVRGAKLKYG